jgi:hypothetical protein
LADDRLDDRVAFVGETAKGVGFPRVTLTFVRRRPASELSEASEGQGWLECMECVQQCACVQHGTGVKRSRASLTGTRINREI